MHIEIKKTADGSSTLYVPELNEHYHSMHGAVSESMHVFIRMGLDKILKPSMMILEIGFGTGLNAILTLLEAGTLKQIQYDCIETGPLTRDQVIALGYENYLHLSAGQREHFLQMHTCTWGERISITNSFSLRKMKVSLQDLEVDNSYDLVILMPLLLGDSLNYGKKVFSANYIYRWDPEASWSRTVQKERSEGVCSGPDSKLRDCPVPRENVKCYVLRKHGNELLFKQPVVFLNKKRNPDRGTGIAI